MVITLSTLASAATTSMLRRQLQTEEEETNSSDGGGLELSNIGLVIIASLFGIAMTLSLVYLKMRSDFQISQVEADVVGVTQDELMQSSTSSYATQKSIKTLSASSYNKQKSFTKSRSALDHSASTGSKDFSSSRSLKNQLSSSSNNSTSESNQEGGSTTTTGEQFQSTTSQESFDYGDYEFLKRLPRTKSILKKVDDRNERWTIKRDTVTSTGTADYPWGLRSEFSAQSFALSSNAAGAAAAKSSSSGSSSRGTFREVALESIPDDSFHSGVSEDSRITIDSASTVNQSTPYYFDSAPSDALSDTSSVNSFESIEDCF